MEQNQNNQRTIFRMPINIILEIILLCALCGIGTKECKRADLRLKRDKIKYERFMDSIKHRDSMTLVLNKDLHMEK